MNNGNERKRGAILSYLSIILSTVVQLVYTPLLIRMLGQSEYGLYSLVSSVIGYLTVLDLGFGNAIVVFTSKYRANKEYDKEKKLHGMFLVVFCVIGLVAGLLGLLLYFNVPLLFGNTMTDIELHKAKIMMLILSFNLAVTFPFSIYSSIITAYEKFTFQKVMSILNTILKPILMIPLLFLGYKSITMTVVITVVNVIVLLSNYLYCKKKLGVNIKFMGFDKQLFKTIFSYSFFIFLGVIVDKVNWSLDQFILGAVSGTVAVSLYSVASQINTLFINLSTAISSVLLPKMSKMVAAGATDKQLTNEMIKVGRMQAFAILLMASGFVLFGKQFITLWLDESYVSAYYIALWLILPLCFPLVKNLGISIRQAKNRHKFAVVVMAITSALNAVVSVFLAKQMGALGSAIGTGVTLLINGVIIDIYYQKVIGLDMIRFWKQIFKVSLSIIVPTALILVFMHYVKIQGLFGFIIYAGLYSLMYFYIVYRHTMNDYEKGQIQKITNKIMRKCKNDNN